VAEVRAIIADDEKPLREYLRARLADAWPELVICGEAGNGKEALDLILSKRPQIAFLDIKMPGLSGMDVAERIAGTCKIVFVTAYDDYAVEAFEREALDYLLKPVFSDRLEKTVKRLKADLEAGKTITPEVLHRLIERLSGRETAGCLGYVRVQQDDSVLLIPVDEVIYFKAEDKYTLVMTRQRESLIRKPIRELIEELDTAKFWQIRRGTIVNVRFIAQVSRSLTGKGIVRLKDRSETLTVSNRYMHLFKQM
jgi:DNA-binding LytR/AlgR family response regulator